MKLSPIAIVLIISIYFACGVSGCWRRHADVVVDQKTISPEVSEARKPKAAITAPNITTEALKVLSETLFRADKNNVGHLVQLNLQKVTTSVAKDDPASSPLFPSLSPKALQGSTTAAFIKLFDNYVELVSQVDIPTAKERKEQEDFLNVIMKTEVMKKTEAFLKKHKAINGTLRKNLKEIWFTPYSRSKGKLGSSGFEHVFIGELKSGRVSGFHNWMSFREEEKKKDLNYKGYIKVVDFGKGEIIKMRFDWMNRKKSVGSMFVGTSPELEMALYTVCFYARRNKGCSLMMNKKKFRIKTYAQKLGKKVLIGSAFPEI